MRDEPLRFKKSQFSGTQSNCVEVAHNLRCMRDSKNPSGPLLRADLRALIDIVKVGQGLDHA